MSDVLGAAGVFVFRPPGERVVHVHNIIAGRVYHCVAEQRYGTPWNLDRLWLLNGPGLSPILKSDGHWFHGVDMTRPVVSGPC